MFLSSTCFALLALMPSIVEGLTRGQTALVTEYEAKLNEVRSIEESFRTSYDSVRQTYEVELAAILDETQQALSTMLARWEQENADLANICATASERTCEMETESLYVQRREEISIAAVHLPKKKMDFVDEYLTRFVSLELGLYGGRPRINEIIHYFTNQKEGFKGSQDEVQMGQIIDKFLSYCNAELVAFEATSNSITVMIGSLHSIVFGNVCFDFVGASQPLEPHQYNDFNQAMEKSLEIAFMQDKKDIDVIAVQFIAQDFEAGQQRMLRTAASAPSEVDEEHRRRLYSRNRVAVVTGVQCNCRTDTLTSDVVGRRDLVEMHRELFSSSFLYTLGEVLKVELDDFFGELHEVRTFHCSAFKVLWELGGLD